MLFGGSNAFGEGLKDEEIITEKISKNTNGIRPYNFSYRGYGPSHALTQVGVLDYLASIKEKKGFGVYLFIPYHTKRIPEFYESFEWNYGNIPHFVKNKDNQLEFKGIYRESGPSFWIKLFTI